jgi:calcineurin-like phosphoesterase family protein
MGAEIVRRWNETVRAEDTVYVLGDIGKRGHLRAVRRLQGRKHLVAGNGDDVAHIAASDVFASIAVARWLPGVLLTHIPVHPSQLRGRTINIHGHLHAATVSDPRYRCVSVEHTNFAPVRLDSLLDWSGGTAQKRLS